MKLLLLTEHFSLAGAGAENDAVRLCTALAERGHEVHVVAEDGESIGGVHLHCPLASLRKIRADLVPDVTIDWGFHDIADVHRVGGAVHREFLPHSAMKTPSWRRWLTKLSHLKGKHRRQIRKEDAILTHSKGLFLPISRFVADQLRTNGVPEDRIQVLHNSVDTDRFHPGLRAEIGSAMRREWNVPEDAVVLLFVANNLNLKNFALLCSLMPALYCDNTAVRLVAVGRCKPRISAPWLIHQPTLLDVERAYAAGDMLVHPSYFDSFGNVVLEAMSCGLPVIVSDTSGVSELVCEGGGRVLSVTDPAARSRWNAAVRELVQSPETRIALGKEGRAVAEQHRFTDYIERFEAHLSACAARP